MASSATGTMYRAVLVASLYACAFVVLVGEDYLLKMVATESRMNRSFYSEDVAKAAEARAERWFSAAFVDTGVMLHSFDMFVATEEEKRATDKTGLDGDFGNQFFGWFEQRLRALWTLVWSAFIRVSSAILWLPFSVLILVPWVVDGWAQRERRKHTFEFSSAMQHQYALIALGLLPLAYLVVLTFPVAMHPAVTPIGLFFAGFLIQQLIAHFMKRA